MIEAATDIQATSGPDGRPKRLGGWQRKLGGFQKRIEKLCADRERWRRLAIEASRGQVPIVIDALLSEISVLEQKLASAKEKQALQTELIANQNNLIRALQGKETK